MAWILGTALLVAAALIAALGVCCLRLERQRAFWAAETERTWLRCHHYLAEINDLRCMLAESEKAMNDDLESRGAEQQFEHETGSDIAQAGDEQARRRGEL